MNINGKELKSGDEVWVLVQQMLPTYYKVKIDKVSKDGEYIKVLDFPSKNKEFPVCKIVNFDNLNSFWDKDCCYLLSFNSINDVEHFAIQPCREITDDKYDDTTHYKGYCTQYTVPYHEFVNYNYKDCVFGTRDALLDYLYRRMNVIKPRNFLNELLLKSVPLIVNGSSEIDIAEWKISSMFLCSNDVDLYAINLSDGSNKEILKSYIENQELISYVKAPSEDFSSIKGWWFYCISNTDFPVVEQFNSAESFFRDWKKVKNFIKQTNIKEII